MTSFKVTLDIVMTVPVWVNEADAPSSLVSRWREYDAALLAHENGHKRIAEAAAAAIQQAGANVSPQSSCAEIGRLVDRIATSVLDQYREKERQYDADTDHGRTQGARFP